MQLIDTHAHIYLTEFEADRQDVLLRAKAEGVGKIFLPNIDGDSVAALLQLGAAEENYCLPMMGLHPCSVRENFEDELRSVEKYLSDPSYRFYGIGECGLDYYWDLNFVPQQKAAFEFQILLAKKYKLPIIIHSRNATDDCIELIAKQAGEELRGIFHCFSGTIEQLEKVIALGFYAGIGGVATFKNGGLDKILNKTHLSHLVLETDSPYLAPVPYRGKRNEPAYLRFILKKLSEIISVTENEIAEITTANANRIFDNS